MQFDREDSGYQRIATLDIETTHYDASKGEIVSVGTAVHDRSRSLGDVTYKPFHRQTDDSEAAIIRDAYAFLNEQDADLLVTFNGKYFDIPFLSDRINNLGVDAPTLRLDTDDMHLDLLGDDRKAKADAMNRKWPTLEEALESYGHECEEQTWRGSELTNTRFGDELGPEYLTALDRNPDQAEELRTVIDEYLEDDLLKNLFLYYYDIGEISA